MILNLLVYLVVFALSTLLVSLFQRAHNRVRIVGIPQNDLIFKGALYLITGCAILFPLIAMSGLRYGIGTDYFNYERIYNVIHNASFFDYWGLHNSGAGEYYVELAYYLLNVLSPSYRALLWGMGILLFSVFFLAIKPYSVQIRFSLALFIFLSLLFIYSLNAMRFTVAVCIILAGYIALANNKVERFVVLVLVASLFHVSSLACLLMLVLMRFKSRDVNKYRDIVLCLSILLFPLLYGVLMRIASRIPAFSRYFSTNIYSAGSMSGLGLVWIMHFFPVMAPLLLFCRKEVFCAEDTNVFFRISVTEIPLRMLGSLNTWYTRLCRFPQIVYVIFIPLILSRVSDRNKKTLLYLYYIAWYVFYFCYYAVVNDCGDSLPYVWIFS